MQAEEKSILNTCQIIHHDSRIYYRKTLIKSHCVPLCQTEVELSQSLEMLIFMQITRLH